MRDGPSRPEAERVMDWQAEADLQRYERRLRRLDRLGTFVDLLEAPLMILELIVGILSLFV
jgi:hypothetical protein